MNTQSTVAAFQSWNNGGKQISSLYIGESVEKFVERHFESGTFANLHYGDIVEISELYNKLFHEIYG